MTPTKKSTQIEGTIASKEPEPELVHTRWCILSPPNCAVIILPCAMLADLNTRINGRNRDKWAKCPCLFHAIDVISRPQVWSQHLHTSTVKPPVDAGLVSFCLGASDWCMEEMVTLPAKGQKPLYIQTHFTHAPRVLWKPSQHRRIW